MTDFTRRSNSAREMERVAIVAVDPASRTATGITRIRTSIQINCAFATGDTITTPAVGEQWYVERLDYEWRLYGRIPFNDATLNIEPEEGQVSVGAATGPLELNGTEVRANGRVFRLNGVYYRDSGETLERSEDGEIWEPIRGTTAGVIQLIANALAGVPGTEAILDLLARLTDDETQALQALRDWAANLGPGDGDGWAPLCDNPFFTSLRALGTGDEPLDQVVSGFQTFINDLWSLLFCDFAGDLTATDALTGIGGITTLLSANPLVQGLADLLGDDATGNLLFDAVAGVSAFLQQLVDTLFCNLDGDITPQGILGAVADLLGPLQNNPFILGLQALADALGVAVGNLFTDAVNGATEFLRQIVNILFCNFDGDLTPQNILNQITDLLDPLINNPFIQGLQSLAEFLGTAVGNLFTDAINGATGLLEGVFRLLFCGYEGDLTPQGILEHIGDLLDPLINNPFVQGLATLAQTLGTGVGSLLGDAINGAFGLLDGVFRAVFCDFDGDLTPQDIIGHIGDLLEPLRTNPFIVGLGELATVFGTGIGNLAADAVNGAVGLLQAVFGAIFCDFSGTFTPQALLTKLTDVLGSVTANPFIAGLIDFAEGLGHTLGGGIEKAFAGANELLEAIFGIFFCDNEGVPTPQLIVDSISDIMDFLRTNPLIEGLVDFITDVGTSSTGFLRKALEGAFEFFNQIVNALFCNLPGQPTPAAILASLAGIVESVTDNPYVQMLRALADALGDTSTNLIQQLLAGVTGIFDWFIDLLNTLVPFFDWNDIKTLNFPSMMADLLDNLNPLAFLGPDGLLPLNKLPELAINTLTGITTFLQDEIFGPLQDAILGGLNTALTGGLAAINEFFDGALGTGGSLLQQVVDAMTGVGTFTTGPLATIRSLFSGITLGGGNLISQITGTLDEFVSNLDIAAMVSRITGININDLPTDPLDALSQFFSGFSTFTGTNTLLSQVLSQAGSNLKPLVSAITGIAESAITDVVATATNYFTNFRALFNLDLGAGFNLAAARDALVGVLNNATAGLLNGSLIGSLGINQVNNLVRFITGKTTGGVPADIEAMFTNLRGMFTAGGTFTLLPGGVFNIAAAANAFITNVLSQATSAIGSVRIPALAIADLGINQISNLISTLTGGATVTEFSNFFANLRTFFGIGSGTGLINLLVAPGSFNLVAALNSFISNVLSQATQALSAGLIPDLAITKITNLVPFLTGKTTGFSAADLDVFFANLRRMFNIGSGAGQINLTVTQTVETLQNALFGVVSTVNNGVNTFLTQSGLNTWLGGGLNLTEIGNFFTNLTSFFKVADFKVAPATFAANLATVAGKFINDVINVATGVLINPLKVLGVGGTGTLSTDLANRPLLTSLTTWLTATGTGNDIQKFFTNLRSTLGVDGVNLLPAGVFDPAAARLAVHDVIKGINDGLADGQRWASQAAMNLRATIDGVAKAILGGSGTYTDLAGVATLFGPLVTTGGTTLLDKLATVITNGTTTLGDFFAGLGGGTATVNSLVHRIVSSITGGTGVQTLASLGTFFGNFTSTATTLVGKVVDHLTGLITSGLSGMTLTNFFSGFNTATTVTGSLAHKIAQSVSGGVATTLSQVTNFFDNLRSFLGIGTTGITLADFLSAPATFATKLTGIINAFITNVLQRTGLSTTLVTLTAGATKLANDLIPDLPMERITNLIGSLTGSTGSSSSDVTNFFNNLRSFLGGGNGFLSAAGTFNLATVTENFINNVLRGNGVTTRLVSLASGLNTIAADIVPALEIGKITNLIGYITGTGAEAADIQKFFTNLRGMFGSTNFLTAAGSFSAVTAANQFIVNVLSKATSAGVGAAKIAADVLTDFSVDKVVNLAKALTGQTLTGASGDLLAVQRFFSGFTGFDPATGANNLVNQITNAVFGANGTLANLRSFFSGFIPGSGAFNPADGTNNLANQIVRAVTGRTGPLADILSFLGVGAVGDATTLNPFTGANSLVSQLVAKITGGAGTDLTHLANLFTNLRTALGLTGVDLHSIAQSAETLRTQVFNVIRDFNAGLNTFISQDKLKEWLGGSATLTQMGNFFANLKTFFGGTGDGSIDLLSGPITFATAVNSFITGILNKGTAGLFNVNLLPTLDITKIDSLVNYITGKTGTVAAGDVDVFFGNLRRMLNHGTDAGQINFNTTQTAADLRGTLFNIVTAVNAGLAGTVNALITGSNLTSWLGAGTVADIKTFFDNLKSLLGGVNLFGAFNPATEINKLFGVLNSATTGALNPLRVLGVGGTGTLSTDLGDRPVLSALTTWLTTSGTANDIQRFITNLRSAVGLSGVNLLAGFDATAARTALYNVVTGINDTVGSLAKQADMALKAGVTEVVKAITGGSATTYGDLSAVTSYFGGLSSMTGSTLLAKITNAITGGVDLTTFFANLRNFFTGGGVNFGAGSFDPVGAVSAFAKRLLDGSDLMSKLNSYSLTITGVPTGGTYRLTYAGQTTAAISYDATAATIQAALAALSSIGAGNVTVSGSLGAGFGVAINNLSGTLGTASVALTGGVNPRVSVSRRIDAGIIPRLGVDWIEDIDDWLQDNFVSPIVSTLITATGIDPTKFGIDLSQVGTSLASGLTALGTWASNLLTGVSRIPAGNLFGSISDALLGVIPVANISNVSPNLIAQGDFAAATTINPSGGWSWDDQNNRTGTGGSAKLTVTAAGTQELFARQSVPVAKDDKLTMSAYVKASGVTGGQASYTVIITGSPTGGTFRLSHGGNTTSSLAHNAAPAVVAEALADLPSIGAGNVTVTGTAGVSYTAVINNLTGPLTASSAFVGPRSYALGITGNPTAGTFTLSYNGSTTSALARNAAASTIQAALTALPSVGAGNATVSGSGSSFAVTVAPTAPATLAVSSTLTLRTHTLDLTNNPTGGTYTLTYGAESTTPLAHNATPAQVAAALTALAGVGTATVTGAGGTSALPYTIILDNQTSTLGTTSSLVSGATPTLTVEFQAWVTGGTGQAYTVTLGNTPTGGTYTLSYGGQTTTALAYNAAPATVQAALAALSSIGAGNVTVSGTAGSSYTVNLTVATSTLTGSSAMTNSTTPVSTVSSSTGAVIAAKAAGRYTVAVSGNPTAGTYTLGYGGQTTTALAYDATAATIQAALAALSSIGAGNVTVSALSASSYTVDVANYAGTLSLVGNSLVSAANAAVTITDNFRPTTAASVYGIAATSWEANGGALTLSYGGSSVAVPPKATAAQVAAALTGLPSVSTATVTGSAGSFTITLGNSKRTLSAADTFLSSSSTSPDAVVTETTELAAVAGGSYTVAVTGSPTGGTYTLGYNGETTTALARNAAPATVQAALAALPSLGAGKVGVVGSATSYTVAVADEASTLTVPGTALTGGTAPKVTVTDTARPLALTLIPFTGTTQLSPIPMATARPGAAWTQMTGTVTLPAGVTTVIARIAHGGAATAAQVWFDDISLTKVGLLQQGLVDRLMDAWEGLWNGVFGSGGLGKLSDSVREALGFLTNQANTGLVKAATAEGAAQTITDGVYEAMTGVSNAGAAPTTVKDVLQLLNQNLFGQNILGNQLQLPAIPNIPVTKSSDMRGLFNNVVLGLSGALDTIIPGDGLPGLDDVFNQTKATNEAIATLSAAVANLQTTTTQQASSGKSDYTNFSSLSHFNGGTGPVYAGGSASSGLIASSEQTSWTNASNATRTGMGILTRTKTDTNWQKIGVAFASAPGADWITNGTQAFNYILGRSNASGSEHVFVKFSKVGFWMGYTTNGLAAPGSVVETMFPAPTGKSWPVAHNFTPGAAYYLECGTNGGETIYRLTRNGVPLATTPATTAYAAYTNELHRYGGFKVQATSNGLWTNIPGSMAALAIADNTPAPLIGSGFRRNRLGGGVSVSANGYNLLPNNFFDTADPGNSTPDYTYTSTAGQPNKITVTHPGWYQVTVNIALDLNSMVTDMAPTLYKNGTVVAKGASVWGVTNVVGRGPSQCAATFTVYLKEGDYIQPGYWQTTAYGASGTMTGDSNGLSTYIQVAFMNRSAT